MDILKRSVAAMAFVVATTYIVNVDAQSNLNMTDSDTSDRRAHLSASVNADDSATEALRLIVKQNTDELSGEPNQATVQGYRIGIFFDNSASARARATEVVEKCNSLLSDLHTTMSYDNPYFKVSTGYSLTQEEAVMMLYRVQKHFPSAYLMRETITPKNIVAAREAEAGASSMME